MDAAKALAEEGISLEVIDPRTLKPLDIETIVRSVAKTGRLVLVENTHRIANLSAEIAATICEEARQSEEADCGLSAPDVHIPFSPALEQLVYPGKAEIVAAVKKLL